MKKRIIALLTILVILAAMLCGCQNGQEEEQHDAPSNNTENTSPVKDPTEKKLNAVDTSKLTLKFDDFSEEFARYYTEAIAFEESEITAVVIPDGVEYADSAELEEARKDAITFIQDTVPMKETFSSVEEDFGDQGIQLHAASEDYSKMFSVSMYLDSTVQFNYVLQWSPIDTVNFEEAATEVQLYTGIKVTADDIKALQNEILEVGNAGSYSFIMTDSLGMNGFYISVSDYNAAAETWQLYVQRYMTVE